MYPNSTKITSNEKDPLSTKSPLNSYIQICSQVQQQDLYKAMLYYDTETEMQKSVLYMKVTPFFLTKKLIRSGIKPVPRYFLNLVEKLNWSHNVQHLVNSSRIHMDFLVTVLRWVQKHSVDHKTVHGCPHKQWTCYSAITE